jgi:hypothetical protein
MQHFDDLYIVRNPPISPTQWASFVARREDFSIPDRYAGYRVYLNDIELDAAGLYLWLGHSSGQQVPVHLSGEHIFIFGIDGETVAFAQRLAFQLDACIIHKVHPLNVAAMPGEPQPRAEAGAAWEEAPPV